MDLFVEGNKLIVNEILNGSAPQMDERRRLIYSLLLANCINAKNKWDVEMGCWIVPEYASDIYRTMWEIQKAKWEDNAFPLQFHDTRNDDRQENSSDDFLDYTLWPYLKIPIIMRDLRELEVGPKKTVVGHHPEICERN